jgi:hypothetical protein
MIPPLLRVAWEQAEARLFQVVTTQPQLYQRAVVLTARLSATLQEECADLPALLALAQTEEAAGWPLVQRVAAEAMLPPGGTDHTLAGRAGCAAAARVLLVKQARSERRRRIADARAAGDGWVVLEESGDPAGTPWAPYRRLEVEVTGGDGVLVSTEPDDDLAGVLHRVHRVRVDPQTGELLIADDAGAAPSEPCRDAAAREDLVARLKQAAG